MQQPTQFCNDDYNSLTFKDKLDILCSINPIYTIITITNCKNPENHNILLEDPESENVEIFHEGKVQTMNTDIALSLLIDSKLLDLKLIIEELSEYLNASFVNNFNKYLNGSFKTEINLRNKNCKHKHIFKKNVNLNKLKEQFKTKTS